MVLFPKNQLFSLLLFAQYFLYSSSSHQNSGQDCAFEADLNRPILSLQISFSRAASSWNLAGSFLFIYLYAKQISLQIYGSQCSNQPTSSSYLFTSLYIQIFNRLHFLLTCSGLTAIGSSKIIFPTHLSSSFLLFSDLVVWIQGSMLFPKSLANSIITFQDFSESFSPSSLKFLWPSSNILLTFSYLFLRSCQLIFQPSLIDLKPNFIFLLICVLQYSSQMCLRAAEMLNTGFLPLLYPLIRQRSRDSCLAAEIASSKESISSECWSYQQVSICFCCLRFKGQFQIASFGSLVDLQSLASCGDSDYY